MGSIDRLRSRGRRLVAGARPYVPDNAMPLLLTARSIVGGGPLVAAPHARRALVLCAHPDDELACAGTVARLAGRAERITVVYATSGEATRGSTLSPAEVGRLRETEATAACRHLGVVDVRFLHRHDGSLGEDVPALAEDLRRLLGELRPDLIFLPWFCDGHRDHQAVGRAWLQAAEPSDGRAALQVWAYETWTPAPVNRIVDVSDVIEVKSASVAEHRTAALAFDLTAMMGLQRYRSVHGLVGKGYAEGFVAGTADQYRAWVRQFEQGGIP